MTQQYRSVCKLVWPKGSCWEEAENTNENDLLLRLWALKSK